MFKCDFLEVLNRVSKPNSLKQITIRVLYHGPCLDQMMDWNEEPPPVSPVAFSKMDNVQRLFQAATEGAFDENARLNGDPTLPC